jgi:hypothetical protein
MSLRAHAAPPTIALPYTKLSSSCGVLGRKFHGVSKRKAPTLAAWLDHTGTTPNDESLQLTCIRALGYWQRQWKMLQMTCLVCGENVGCVPSVCFHDPDGVNYLIAQFAHCTQGDLNPPKSRSCCLTCDHTTPTSRSAKGALG